MSDSESISSGSVSSGSIDISSSSKSGGLTDKSPSSFDETSSTASLKKELARRETEFIFKLRLLVIFLLIIVAAGVSALVFIITTRAEEDEMMTQFEGASQQILDAFDAIRTDRISTLSSLAVAAIAHGVDHSRSWPFVALSSFQQRCFTARENSGILQVSINTLVTEENREDWEHYVVEEVDSQWIQEAHDYQAETGVVAFIEDYGEDFNIGVEMQPIAHFNEEDYGRYYNPPASGPYLPNWELSPLLSNDDINIDIFADERQRSAAEMCLETGAVVLGEMHTESPGGIKDSAHHSPTKRYAQLLSIAKGTETQYLGDPMTSVHIPIFDSFDDGRTPKAVMSGLFNWAIFFEHILPPHVEGIDVVLHNNCFGSYTYRVSGGNVVPRGKGDLHNHDIFDHLEAESDRLEQGSIADGTRSALSFHEAKCSHWITIHPSQAFQDTYKTSTPTVITFAVAVIFAFAVAMFVVYDRLVERRQKLVLQKAVQSTAIVSSLFPKNVRDRLMQTSLERGTTDGINTFQNTTKLKNLVVGPNESATDSDQPIADLFPNCTVMFADIAGFTAWSSTRDPAQVFTLLQTVYQAFDKIAARLRVFKVETIGDSYVAVTGLPEPQQLHAVIMAKFAAECRVKLVKVTRNLEVVLGPDTGDLSMRFGLHSGPVTAGVLRGDRARFQLFGDTVNTAARMESTGIRGKIQISPSTAELLRRAGKHSWVRPRKEAVNAKGLGTINTYFLDIDGRALGYEGVNATEKESPSSSNESSRTNTPKNERLVNWMTEILSDYVKKVVAKRTSSGTSDKRPSVNLTYRCAEGRICLDEVVEALTLPKFDGKGLYDSNVDLPPQVFTLLRDYVSVIAEGYNSNPFHNFDHACHVTMSVHKLLKRVVTPDISDEDLMKGKIDSNHLAHRLHDFTHGINSDPMTSLAIVFSALIHDVDHRGVSNIQMGKEEPKMAAYYKQKSLAEQNSLDIAWDLLMSKRFEELRACMFGSKSDLMRFRHALVNLVLATDIFDKELNDLRKARWAKAFHTETDKIETDLRATIVLEHIIQASDVSHTMQHWHVYVKWNRRLFLEMTAAYRAGRMGADPADFWYEGELKFFDNYIIPMAKKLQECHVFGVSSDEYLNYAKSNRTEWEEKGMAVLQELKAEAASMMMGESI